MTVYATASDEGAAQVHLGANFPLTLTLKSTTVDGKAWAQVTWQTPGRHGTGWVEASALTMIQPSGRAMASFDALDTGLADYLTDYGTRVGVELLDVTRGVVYGHNADRPYVVASSMKVPIMLTLLTQLEAKGRGPNATELSLLTTMIENSNNNSATALYTEIGYQAGINAFMKKVGISGLTPQTPHVGWGFSTITPAAMVSLLELLHEGKILNATDRALALKLMEHIQADQRVGVGDSSPAGATIALKDGVPVLALGGSGGTGQPLRHELVRDRHRRRGDIHPRRLYDGRQIVQSRRFHYRPPHLQDRRCSHGPDVPEPILECVGEAIREPVPKLARELALCVRAAR